MHDLLPRLPAAARDYIAAWKIAAVTLEPSGRVRATINPTGAVQAWWCRSALEAKRIAEAAQATGDVETAARHLGMHLTPHDQVIARTQRRTAALERALERAKADGLLRSFNVAYRARREAAAARGQAFMRYGTAQRRLRAALARAIAQGELPTVSLFAEALDAP